MDTLKINFGYFWPSFNKEENHFTNLLSTKYKLEISNEPDLYFFTHDYEGTRDYLKYQCHRIFIGWENQRANWLISDYVLDSDFVDNNPMHKRYPIWATWNPTQLTREKNPNLFIRKEKFCCMLVSNGQAKERLDFFQKLSKYKKVDSGGKFLNNIGRSVDDKMAFIKDYKFVISFENSSSPGYTTEKLIEPMIAGSIPIYWGNKKVGHDFNTRSFINIHDFKTQNDAIAYIIDLDKNDQKYDAVCRENWFHNNNVPMEFADESLMKFFDFIIAHSKITTPIASSIFKKYLHEVCFCKNMLLWELNQSLGFKKKFR